MQLAGIHHDEQKTLRHERSKQCDDAKVPYLSDIQTGCACSALGQEKARKYAEGGNCAVRRNDERADVKEYGMHLEQHTA